MSSITTDQIQSRGYSDKEVWRQCIHDIQDNIIHTMSDIIKVNNSSVFLFYYRRFYFLQVEKVSASPPALLLVDPAYHGNVGDNLIVYGELVLMERLGFTNHTECNIIQSAGLSRNCSNFSHLDNGGMAWWHGGGNWGDLWDRKDITLR